MKKLKEISKIHDACGRGHKFHHVILALNRLEELKGNEKKDKELDYKIKR